VADEIRLMPIAMLLENLARPTGIEPVFSP
jgi:hypothetical protein